MSAQESYKRSLLDGYRGLVEILTSFHRDKRLSEEERQTVGEAVESGRRGLGELASLDDRRSEEAEAIISFEDQVYKLNLLALNIAIAVRRRTNLGGSR